MNKHFSYMLLWILPVLFAGCAGVETREELLSRYDTINPNPEVMQIPLVRDAILAYNSEDYWTSAIGFFKVTQEPQLRGIHDTATFYFAESLYRLGMYKPCTYLLSNDILFKGPDNSQYFTPALIRLLMITYETGDEDVIFAVLSSVELTSFPQKFQNELVYLLGRMYFQQGQIDEAYIKFSQVQENSVFYAKANYFRGIIEIKRKEYDKAKTTFDMIQRLPEVAVEFGESQKVKEMSKIATGQLYYAAGHDAGDEDKDEIFYTAIRYYDRVSRSNVRWFDSLFQKTWAATLIGRFDVSLGTSLTLASPFFDTRFIPETHLIEAITWFQLCRYREADRKLKWFFRHFEPMEQGTATYLAEWRSKPSETVFDDMVWQYKEAYRNPNKQTTALSIQILTHLLNDSSFTKMYLHIQQFDKEFAIMENAPKEFLATSFHETTVRRMERQQLNLRKRAGKYLLRGLSETHRMLRNLIGNAQNVDVEVSSAMMEQAQKRDIQGLDIEVDMMGVGEISEEMEKLRTPAVRDDFQWWPFDGEYWYDELGYYLMTVDQKCE